MRTADPALVALLASGRKFLMADLHEFILPDGVYDINNVPIVAPTVIRYTTADRDITIPSWTWEVPAVPFLSARGTLKRGGLRWSVGIEVDDLSLTISADPNRLIKGMTFPQFARSGQLDGASYTLRRIFFPSWGNLSIPPLTMFAGKVFSVEGGGLSVDLTIKSEVERYNTLLPKRVFQATCMNTLFDSGCGRSRWDYEFQTTAFPLVSRYQFEVLDALQTGYFEQGFVQFRSGVNAGLVRTIRRYDSTGWMVDLFNPLLGPIDPAGDAISLFPGCNKTRQMCDGRFLGNFQAYPYIPPPESTI